VCLAVPRVVSKVVDRLEDLDTTEVLVHRHLETGKREVIPTQTSADLYYKFLAGNIEKEKGRLPERA
jgi:hypothetical protein